LLVLEAALLKTLEIVVPEPLVVRKAGRMGRGNEIHPAVGHTHLGISPDRKHAGPAVSTAVPEVGAVRCNRKVGGHVAGNFSTQKPLRALVLRQEKRVAGHSAHTEGKFAQVRAETTMTRS
jgi:hypothetical protein